MSCRCVFLVAERTLAFHFRSPNTEVSRAGKRVGNAINPEGKNRFRKVMNHINPRELGRHNIVPGSKIAVLAKAVKAWPHFISFNLFHSFSNAFASYFV